MSGQSIRRFSTPILSSVRLTGSLHSSKNGVKFLSSAHPLVGSRRQPAAAAARRPPRPPLGVAAATAAAAGPTRLRSSTGPGGPSGPGSGARAAMDLRAVVGELDRLAPPPLAESWDNVGLLVEPSPPHAVRTLLLANDLTEPVLAEAAAGGADLVLAYHPPIFRPLKRLTMADAKQRLVVRAIESRVAISPPPPCHDALEGGVNDWLAATVGETPLYLATATVGIVYLATQIHTCTVFMAHSAGPGKSLEQPSCQEIFLILSLIFLISTVIQ